MRTLSKIAEELRNDKKRKEHIEEKAAKLRCQKIDEIFCDRMGSEYMQALEAESISRHLFVFGDKVILRLAGYDSMANSRYLDLPVTEDLLKEMNPDNMIMMLDKYILRGYEIPAPNPDGTILFNLSLEDLGPSMDIFSAN